jgi:hypothetical protein
VVHSVGSEELLEYQPEEYIIVIEVVAVFRLFEGRKSGSGESGDQSR